MPIQIPFSNRETAGEEVAKLLPEFSNSEAIVVALPRGGVVTAKAVSRALRLPLEIVVVKKIGHPFNPEYALGAITEKGFTALNEKELQNIPPDWFTEEKEKKLAEAVHKRDILWDDRQILPLRDQVVIIVDDGIATGYTLLAAIQHVKAQNPKKIIVAVPPLLEEIREVVFL